MLSYFKQPVVIVAIVSVVAVGGLVFAVVSNGDSQYETAIATRVDLIQEVSVTGRVVAAQHVNLAFEKSGRVAWVGVDIGDSVYIGQTLVQLENGNEKAQLDQAKASLKIQQITLSELLRGSRDEEIEIQKIKVANAQLSLKEGQQNLVNVLQNSLTNSDDAIRNKVDQFISNPRGSRPKIDFIITDSQLKNSIEQDRVRMELVLTSWQTSIATLSVDIALDSYVNLTKLNLSIIKAFLDDVSLAVNILSPSSDITQAIIDGYKTDISTARTNINTAISNLSSAEEKLSIAQSTLSLQEQELVLKEAGATVEKITAQEAKVEEAEANVNKFKAQLAKTILWTPIKGIVAEQKSKVGEIIPAHSVIISIISTTQFEIETNIPEADIAEVAIGDTADITLDAYSDDEIFKAIVVSINPAETIIEGVATYKATLQFAQKDERIKSGMTANIDILINAKENVIAVPTRSIISRNGDKIVRIVEDGIIKEVVVEVGLRSSEGTTEIVFGVKEGDEIIVLIKK